MGLPTNIFLKAVFLLYTLLTIPHLLAYTFSKRKDIIKSDLDRWSIRTKIKYTEYKSLVYLLMKYPEFRNVFYYRLGGVAYHLLNIILPKLGSLYITTTKIGNGLFIHHGFATIISARTIGDNCWINQQVTIGFSNDTDCPTIGNNVRICAGAKVIGNITVGDNCVIGANAVVVKNVPAGCTVAGIPAVIIKRNGDRINNEPL